MKHKILCALVIAEALAFPANASPFIGLTFGSAQIQPRIAAETLPEKFDLRDENRIPPIRNQNPWGTCWAHAAMASMESSYITSFHVNPEDVDFSEMFLVWFSRINLDKSHVFSMYNRGKARLIHMGDYGTALTEGAYPAAAIARVASLEGPADEKDFPYLGRSAFLNAGYSVSNPPTHEEAERAGLIPFMESTPQKLRFTGKTVTPRHDLMMTDALYAASRTAPSSFANQREDYAQNNRVNNNVLKYLIKTYGAAMICYYSDEEPGKNFNTEHSAYFDNSSWLANHEINVIGWDDNFPKENFINPPSSNGAWLARNSWGNFTGSDGGYEWISYEQLVGDGIVCVMKERPASLRKYEHDPLGWCNSYTYREKEIWGANVFQVQTTGETLHSVSFYTPSSNMQADVFIYDLGTSFDGVSPRAGTLLASASTTLPYAGYHTVELVNAELTRGHFFSAVVRYVDLNEGDDEYAGVPVEVAVKGYSNNAAVYDRGSYFSDAGEEWLDGTTMIDDFHGGVPYHVNACIKAFTIAPNDDELEATEPKTIMNIVPVDFSTPYESISTEDIPHVSSVSLTAQGVSGNDEVRVYLAEKSRTYEPVKFTNSGSNSLHARGLGGPSEWALVPVYATGYVPDFFAMDDGINYATYGPFIVKADEYGKIEVDVNGLKYADGKAGKIPHGYYSVFIAPYDGGASEIGIFIFDATDNEIPSDPIPDAPTIPDDSDSSAPSTSSSGGGGGGCNTGILCASALVLVFLTRKK